jgi:nitric oxide reductase large subunit
MRDDAHVSTVSPSPAALSPWWRHAVILTMIGGFTVLIWLSIQVYHDAPPIPAQVVSPAGDTLFTHADILAGPCTSWLRIIASAPKPDTIPL